LRTGDACQDYVDLTVQGKATPASSTGVFALFTRSKYLKRGGGADWVEAISTTFTNRAAKYVATWQQVYQVCDFTETDWMWH
jgi:hypothetical protein